MRWTQARTLRERYVLAAAHFMGVLDAMVYFGTFTLFTTELRAKAIFYWYTED